MLNFKDSIKLSKKKLSQRKVSSFFSGCFVALGAIILIVSIVSVNSIKQYVNSIPTSAIDNEFLVQLRKECYQISTFNEETANWNTEISQKQQLLQNSNGILTEAQITKIKDEIKVLEDKIAKATIAETDQNQKCIETEMDVSKLKKEHPEVTSIYRNEIIQFGSISDKLKDIKVDGYKEEDPSAIGDSYYSDISIKEPKLSVDEAFNKEGNIYSPKEISSSNPYDFMPTNNLKNISFEISPDSKLVGKYLYKNLNFDLEQTDVIKAIVPISFVNQLEGYGDSTFESANALFDPNKSKEFLNNQKNTMDKWGGQTIEINLYQPSKVEVKTFKTPYQPAEIPESKVTTITQYKKLNSVLKVKIVGFTADDTTSGYNYKFITTSESINREKLKTKVITASNNVFEAKIDVNYFAGIRSKNEKDAFLKNYSMNTDFNIFSPGEMNFDTKEFKVGDQKFMVSSLDSGRNTVISFVDTIYNNVFRYIGYAFLFIASVIIFLILSKSVTESTKEIAIFRSFGAQKLDIGRIYITYCWMIITLGFAFAFIISYGVLAIMAYTPMKSIVETGTFMATSYLNPYDLSFITFPMIDILYIYIICLTIGLIASLFPILRAVRIQPVVAMRNE